MNRTNYMKKIIIILFSLFTIFPVIGFSQNGGQLNENRVIKIDYVGWSVNNYVFRVTNKQMCDIRAQIKILTSPSIIDTIIRGNSFILIYINSTNQEEKVVKARALDFCGGGSPDRGWVESKLNLNLLPIKFKNVQVKRIDKNTIYLIFEVNEDNSINHYKVMISTDGRKYTEKVVVFPNGIEGNKKYEIKIKL